jgi:Zn-dependent protease with chaperone function
MRSFLGQYYSSAAEPREASVLIFDKEIQIGWRDERGQAITHKWDIRQVQSLYRASEQISWLRLAGDRTFELGIPGKEADAFVRETQAELAKPWHRKEKTLMLARSLVLLTVILGLLVGTYFLAVPWLSEKMASRVSIQTEEEFGDAIYGGMGFQGLEDESAGLLINHFFDAMKVPTDYTIRISVIRGGVVNAFALPGGRIVVYSALLNEIESYPALAALLAHEFTHIHNRHSTKSIFRRLGSRIFLGLVFGKFGNVSSVLADQADNLKSLTYSRSLEKEADLEGLAILQERQIDPGGFADLFNQLKKAGPASNLPELLESHPDIDKRVAYIREQAGKARVTEHSELKDIFTNLKQKTAP